MAPPAMIESGRASDQGRSRQRRHRPRRHRRARHAVLQPGRRDRGARIDDAPVARQDRPGADQACRRRTKPTLRKLVQLRLREVHLPRGPLPHARGAQSGSRSAHRRRRTGIFTQAEYNADGEFRKTAAVMKMVINGYAGAGTVTMGGYDYHGQGRNTGETRNFRAGRCIGACLEYAARMQQAAHDLRVQRRLAVGQRRAEQHRRRPRQARLGERQPVDRRDVRAGLRPAAAASAFRDPNAHADRLDERRRRRWSPRPARRPTRSTCWSRPCSSTTWRCTARKATSRRCSRAWPGWHRAARQPHDVRAGVQRHGQQSGLSSRSFRPTNSRERGQPRCRVLPTLPCPFWPAACTSRALP